MKHLIFFTVLLAVTGVTLNAQSKEAMTHNPLIYSDVPDIALVRVGDTYYMSSTTMHMSPGLPIMKSTDLVNWELVSYAYDTLTDNEKLRLENGQNAYGAGSWASSIRYHNDVFYVTTFSSTSGKTHVYTTRDIENGPWTASEFSPMLHDHTLFFDDDGRVYMLYGGGDIRLVELKADLSGIMPGSEDRVIIENAGAVAAEKLMLHAEGSQLVKHKVGTTYLISPGRRTICGRLLCTVPIILQVPTKPCGP
ncbi:glycoside hydrolase 43 family protein [Geofilum rubicundum]|uniref:Glycoside hydrolase n=1 Tax=Geofilum rubicundum JCM 15548 TaxID=1236989 RepID=A0A0E9LUB7_9BACT|nr:glycoside hydrolase 43 family protein [Geofilum rubicundum]GAO28873.1 glycoside hydrolase [Geofilum rubicundum JCM 15548]